MKVYPLHLTDHYHINDTIDESDYHETWVHILYYTQAIYILPIIICNVTMIFIFSQVKLLRTPSNCTIVMLAVADLLMGTVVIPITIVKHFHRHFFRTSLFRCFLDGPLRVFLFNLTISMIMLLTLERYIAVIHPFWYSSRMSMQKIILGGAFIIFIDLGVMSLYQYYIDIASTKTNNFTFCDVDHIPDWVSKFSSSLFVLKLAISIICTASVVTLAIRAVREERKRTVGFTNKDSIANLKSDAKVTAVLMFLFVVLLAPTPILAVIAKEHKHAYAGVAFHFAYLNSAVNIVVYAFTKGVYKTAFVFLLTNRPCKWNNVAYAVRSYYATQSKKKESINVSRMLAVMAVMADSNSTEQSNEQIANSTKTTAKSTKTSPKSTNTTEKSTKTTDKSVASTNTIAQSEVSGTQNKTTRPSCCTSPILSSPDLPAKDRSRSVRSPSVASWLGLEHLEVGLPKTARQSWFRSDDEQTTSSNYTGLLSSDETTATTSTNFSSVLSSSDNQSLTSQTSSIRSKMSSRSKRKQSRRPTSPTKYAD